MDRDRVLAKVKAVVQQDGHGHFCFVCGAAGLRSEPSGEGDVFVCQAGHRSPRAYIFDGKAQYTFADDKLIHETVGALVLRRSGPERQTLLFLRRKYPLQYTVPAGHLEIGHDPRDEMARELFEETGLAVRAATQLWPDESLTFFDPCRRGADWHRWHLFLVDAAGTPQLSDEGRIIGWYTDEEVRRLAAEDLLTRPVRDILTRMGYLDRYP